MVNFHLSSRDRESDLAGWSWRILWVRPKTKVRSGDPSLNWKEGKKLLVWTFITVQPLECSSLSVGNGDSTGRDDLSPVFRGESTRSCLVKAYSIRGSIRSVLLMHYSWVVISKFSIIMHLVDPFMQLYRKCAHQNDRFLWERFLPLHVFLSIYLHL